MSHVVDFQGESTPQSEDLMKVVREKSAVVLFENFQVFDKLLAGVGNLEQKLDQIVHANTAHAQMPVVVMETQEALKAIQTFPQGSPDLNTAGRALGNLTAFRPVVVSFNRMRLA